MIVDPIGVVRSPRQQPVDDDWDGVVATITLDAARFSPEALAGLGEFSHLEVVYLFDRVDPDGVQTADGHPRGNRDWPKVGIFAQRAKARPNRIGVSICRLLAVDGLTVTVQALDAIDGTPVLDIKPHLAEFAPRGEVRQPSWSHELMAGYWTVPAPADQAGRAAATRRSYDAVAERYAAEIGDELANKPLDRALLDALGESCVGGTVADIGCGPGHVGGYIAAHGIRVVGVDLSPVMCLFAHGSHGLPAAAGDMTALPLRSASMSGVICWYALIHLDPAQRATAYREIARVLCPGATALVAFHTSDADTQSGSAKQLTEWWDLAVELTFRFLDPGQELDLARAAGLRLVVRLDREPYDGLEYPSRRSYLVVRKMTR
ncbi:MAG: TrmO family methyltransferase domain-containing protein [Mycobacteriales bacterium]